MLILGLLLVVASGAAAAVLIAYNSGGTAQTVDAFGRELGDFTLAQAFIAGVVVALVFLLGLAMVMMAGRRGRENRARYREARREAKAAAAERDELAEKLRRDEENRAKHDSGQQTVVTTPPASQPAAHNQPTQPVSTQGGTPSGAPAAAPNTSGDTGRRGHEQQPVITNIRPGQSPSR
ncbi:hypothetical protein [Actinophytocola xanthii]|uniref:Lipopolysaccharide assembly protein A domain-containing protein n=1 Tax=Actinophytocola xanthii TaxID=1912961 RepID=A0A1Q8CQY3_9PSEU|nr:hypothetical protein [Actinophytocola xanthii]OLF16776.1 hypothetical protein BU204_15030 [Actinophytocola xanthii]